jgi:hypothetical protein
MGEGNKQCFLSCKSCKSCQALRPFAAEGLHSALYVLPVSGVLLGLVLFAAGNHAGGSGSADSGELETGLTGLTR